MDMKLLRYEILLEANDQPLIKKERTDGEEILLDQVERSNRTKSGIKLEVAYKILEDYKGIETSEEYLEEFVERFLNKKCNNCKITPGEIEEWLDKELDAPVDLITGQKQD